MVSDYIDKNLVLGYEFEPSTITYTDREVILYALGIGAGKDPLDPQELAFVYEGNLERFNAFPTFAFTFPGSMLPRLQSLPGLKFEPMRLLHGEQYLEILKPLPTSAQLTSRSKISHIFDKGKGVLIVVDTTTEDETGQNIAFNQNSLFIRGIGGFGGERGPSGSEMNVPPKRVPDAIFKETVPANQALLYRLAGDRNPLHADPSMASTGGYGRPILHGLCTLGFAARAVLKAFAENNPSRFISIKTRFARHFFPGETLVTEMWSEGEGVIIFRSLVAERNEYILSNSMIALKV